MRKGALFADIFDSAETIAQAQKEGYHLCSDEEAAANGSAGGRMEELMALTKEKLIELAKEKGFDGSFVGLNKDKIAEKIIELETPRTSMEITIPLDEAKRKEIEELVVEAGICTKEEAAAYSDADLLAQLEPAK